MRKAAILLALLFSFNCISVHAETFSGGDGWKVEFDGDSMESNFKTADLSEAAYALQPGDTASFHVEIANTSKIDTDWYLTNEVLRSLEDSQSVAEGGAYSYFLSYTDVSGNETVIYNNLNVGGETDGSREGLYEATQSLEGWMYLDRLKPGEKGEVSLIVGLDGETQGNDYQDTLARLQLNFAVEKADPGASIHTGDGKSKLDEIIKTGDNSDFLFWSAIMVMSGLLVLVFLLGARKKKIASMFLLFLMCALISHPVSAKEPYTYTVRIYTGNQGTFAGKGIQAPEKASVAYTGKCITVSGLNYGDIVAFDAAASGNVELGDSSRYYVQGIREAGKDNDTIDGTAILVDADKRYVAAYGIRGKMTEYTVRYVDKESGEELLPSRTYEGKTGDKPVAAYLYVDGYQPNAYNIAKTLDADGSKNIFTFEYTKVANADNATGDGTAAGSNADGSGNGTEANAGDSAVGQGNVGDDALQPGTVTGGEASLVPQESAELRQIEEEDTPLAFLDLDDEASVLFSNVMTSQIRSIVIIVCSAIILSVFIVLMRRKEKEY